MQHLAPAEKRTEILPLTGLRGVAAMWVVVLHLVESFHQHGYLTLQPFLINNLLHGGDFAVDVFFILSGYILTYVYGRKSDVATFFVHRFARIFPLHIFVLCGMVAGILCSIHLGIRFDRADQAYFNFPVLPYHFLLIFVWLNMPIAWNGPAWSLSAEFFAYLLFPLAQHAARGVTERPVHIMLTALLIFEVAMLTFLGFHSTGSLALLRACSGFALGGALQLSSKDYLTFGYNLKVLSGDILTVGIIVLIAMGLQGLAIIPTVWLINILAGTGRGFCHNLLCSRVGVWLGRISFSIYLLHAPILIAGSIGLKHFPAAQQGAGLILFTFTYFSMVLVASTITYNILENPCRYAIQTAWKSWRVRWPPAPESY